MASEIRTRRFNTEMENIEKISKELIQVERAPNYLNNGTILTINFNTKDHPYNPKVLLEKSEFLSYEDAEGDDGKETENIDEAQLQPPNE